MKSKKSSKASARSPGKPAARAAVKKPAKAAAKPAKASGLRAVAARVKQALGAKAKPRKPAKVAARPSSSQARTSSKPSVKVSSPMQDRKNNNPIVAPKGLLTEAQLRRMSDRDYMNDAQLLFFRHKLLEMRQEVLDREVEVKERLHEREVFADPADRATAEEEHWLDLRLRERESLLLRKIDDALRRIEAKEFGYCEKTGDPIGIPRLLARPTATVCVDVKGQDERVEAQFRDR